MFLAGSIRPSGGFAGELFAQSVDVFLGAAKMGVDGLHPAEGVDGVLGLVEFDVAHGKAREGAEMAGFQGQDVADIGD